MGKYLIIADDFTGSNDTGVQMKKRGIPVDVVLFPETNTTLGGSIVLDTESRNISSEESVKKVKRLLGDLLENNNFDIIYKKIDSTLRGNVKEEIALVKDMMGGDKIIFAPAYPAIGRTTRDGIHYLHEKPLLETEIAKDPIKPIRSDHLADYLPDYGKVVHHSLKEIRDGNINIEDEVCHTFDVEESDDMVSIARAVLETDYKVLWVGSAGLIDGIFSIIHPNIPSMAVVASLSEISFKQMDYAEDKGYSVIQIPPEELFHDDVHKVSDIIIDSIRMGNDTIFTPSRSRKDYDVTIEMGKSYGLDRVETAKRVQKVLGHIARTVLEEVEVSGLFLTGGDTAISIIESLEASGSSIEREVEIGVVMSSLKGGTWDGLPIITKAGAFGNEKSLTNSLDRLKEVV